MAEVDQNHRPNFISTLLHVNDTPDYDRYVDPKHYDRLAKLKGRERLATYVAETLHPFLLTSADDRKKVLVKSTSIKTFPFQTKALMA